MTYESSFDHQYDHTTPINDHLMLQDELDHLTALIHQETSPRLLQVLDTFVQDLQRERASQYSLTAGDTVANFTLQDQHYRPVTLYDQLNEGPVLLKFFRGGWCPYCNLELKALHHARPEIEYRGAQLLAVTPESPENMAHTVRKNSLDYPVLHDLNSEVARQFGVAVQLSDHLKTFYRSLGLNLSLRHADVLVRLPLPALYLIDTDYTVRYAFVDEDYRQRAEITEVVGLLHNISRTLVPSYG